MDDYRIIEIEIAKKFGVKADSTRKSIGDFFIDNDPYKPVNVKSNNIAKKNYSPNIISAKKLVKWVHEQEHELFFVFVDYKKIKDGIEIIKDSGLVPVQHLSWECLTIEAQGWGVIQMSKPLKIDTTQDLKGFFKGLKSAYEVYIGKETEKMKKIKEMIKDF